MRLTLRWSDTAVGKSRPLVRPVTHPELLKTELISILKQIGSLLCISSLLFLISWGIGINMRILRERIFINILLLLCSPAKVISFTSHQEINFDLADSQCYNTTVLLQVSCSQWGLMDLTHLTVEHTVEILLHPHVNCDRHHRSCVTLQTWLLV